MADVTLYCPNCNIQFPTDGYDPERAYECPRCHGGLVLPQAGAGSGARRRVELGDEDLLPQQRLGPYRILRKLGQGAMGAVYQAEHTGLHRQCALKVLDRELAAMPGVPEAFHRAAGAAVQHPCIAKVYGAGEAEGRHFVEAEYVEGEDLQTRVSFDGRMSVTDATTIIREAAIALGAAHAQGAVHRDIHPANIMVATDGTLKLTDLGLIAAAQGQGQAAAGAVVGTPEYMSPEQFEVAPVDARSDIYSLGITYLFLLTGQPPFTGSSALSIMIQHKSEPVPDPRVMRRDLPPTVCHVIRKCMAKDPSERYQTCEQLVTDLDGVLEWEVQMGAGGVGALSAKPPLHRRVGFLVACAAAAIAIACVGGWLLRGRGPGKPRRPDSGQTAPLVSSGQAATATAAATQTVAAQNLAGGGQAAPDAGAKTATVAPLPGAATQTAAAQPDEEHHTAPPGDAAPKLAGGGKEPKPDKKPKVRELAGPLHAAPKVDVAAAETQAAIDALDEQLAKLASEREYDKALRVCTEAAAMSGAVAQHAQAWREQIEACQQVVEQARGHAQSLVGKTYRLPVKVGKKGRMTLTGVVEKFEDDMLFLRVGSMVKIVRFAQLGPEALITLSSGDQTPSAPAMVQHARLLLVEGREKEAGLTLQRVERVAQGDADTQQALAKARAFLSLWQAREERAEQERLASAAIQQLKQTFVSGDWKSVPDAAAKLKKTFAETQAFRRNARLADLLALSAKKRLALAETRKSKIKLWRRIGPRVAVPGVGGRHALQPAGWLQDAIMIANGAQLAVAHSFGVDLWSMSQRKILRRLDGHTAAVTVLARSPDGSRLATGSRDQTVCLWDTATGERQHVLKGRQGSITALAFSPDGSLLATGSADAQVRLWDVATGQGVAQLQGHKHWVLSIRFSPDGKHLLTRSYDRTAKVWDVAARRILFSVNAGRGVRQAEIDPAGKLVAVGCQDGTVRLWDIRTRKETAVLKGHQRGVTGLAFHPTKGLLATAARDGSVRLWQVPAGKPAGVLKLGRREGYAVDFSPDGRWLAAASGNQPRVYAWDIKRGAAKRVVLLETGAPTYRCRFSADGHWLLARPNSGGVKTFRMPKGEDVSVAKGYASRVQSLAITRDGSRLAYQAGVTRIVSLGQRRARAATVPRNTTRYTPLAFTPDGKRLACTYRNEVWLVSGRTGRRVASYAPYKRTSVSVFQWNADGSRLACGLRTGDVCVWLRNEGTQLNMATKLPRYVAAVAITPDGKQVAATDRRGTVKLWNGATGAEAGKISSMALRLVYAPNGDWLACGEQQSISLFDPHSRQKLRRIPLGDLSLTDMAVSGDGKWLVVGGDDGRVRVVDAESGETMYEFADHRDTVTSVAVSSAAPPVIAAGSNDGSVCVWRSGAGQVSGSNPGAAELAWLEKMFAGELAQQPVVADLDMGNVVFAGDNVLEVDAADVAPAPAWVAGAQLLWEPNEAGEELGLAVAAPAAGTYRIAARVVKGPRGATLQLRVKGEDVGDPQTCKADSAEPAEVVEFGSCTLAEGKNELRFVAEGAADAVKGAQVGIDAIILWPQAAAAGDAG